MSYRRRRIYYQCSAFLVLFSLFTTAASGNRYGLRIVESTSSSITIEFIPQYDSVQVIRSGASRFELLSFAGAAVDASGPGLPDTRFISIPLALPGREGSTVDIVSADYALIGGFNQAPVPRCGLDCRAYTADYSGIRDLYPARQASIVNIARMHGRIVGFLKLYPVQYQPSTRILRQCTRMVVRVVYGNADVRPLISGDDAWARTFVNYRAAKAWYAPGSGSMTKAATANSVRATGQWYRLETADDGMVKIDAAYLRAQGVDPLSLSSIRDIRIYGSPGRSLSTDIRMAGDADPSQCAVMYEDKNSNGKFDTDDAVLFYAHGATGWSYDLAERNYSHWINPYTSNNYYLMQIASSGPIKEIRMAEAPPSASTVISRAAGMVFFDEEKLNFNQSGQIWVGPPMDGHASTRVITNKLANRVPGSSVTYAYDLYAQAEGESEFTITESGAPIAAVAMRRMTAAEIHSSEEEFARETRGSVTVVPPLDGDRSTVRMTYTATSSNAAGYINWLEILYQKQLVASGDELSFTSPDTDGSVEYPLSGFTTNLVAGFDITDLTNVKKLDLQLQQQMGTFRFRDELRSGAVKSYWIGAPSAYKTPKSSVKLPNSNLHGSVPGADFLILTHSDFVSEARRLKSHKDRLTGADTLRTMVVEVDSVYNEFGNGMPDPTSIRNFLLYASEHWEVAPRYLLLFGDASFDYKGLAGTDKGWVPTYESFESNSKIKSYCTDDYIACVDSLSPGSVGLGIGRLPVRTIEEARFAVDRIIRYETNPVPGPWTNRVTVVADDRLGEPKDTNETYHTVDAEELAQLVLPRVFDIKKIYLAEYPTVITPQGRRKPDARQAIIDQVNRGTLMLNFTGHGNQTVWTHESILSLEDTKTVFGNDARLTFIVAATCDWGRFDATDVQSSAEECIRNREGGAIGVVAASRGAFSGDNSAFNQSFCRHAFPDDPFAPVPRLGDVIMMTKNDVGEGTANNTAKYHLFCDPTLRLSVPRRTMTIDSINGTPTASALPDTIRALQKVTVKASVRNEDMTVDRAFDGTAILSVYDAETIRPLPYYSEPYIQQGGILFSGENSVVNGRLEAAFIVPKDISYDNKNGKISVYFSSGASDGRGYTTNFMVGGTARATAGDTEGPAVSIYFDRPSFTSGDVVGEEPTLIVSLSDSSGINSAGTGIGHRIEAWIDENPKSVDLTEYYKSRRDSYQEGVIEYRLPKFAPGTHRILVKAWDVYNNPSTAEASFTVASGTGLSLLNVYNIPNPVSRATTFTFQHNQLSPLDVEIKIYSVAGRLIAQLERLGLTERFVQIPWDCRDNDGDTLGNGVYFYRVTARTVDGRYASEALGKLAVVK